MITDKLDAGNKISLQAPVPEKHASYIAGLLRDKNIARSFMTVGYSPSDEQQAARMQDAETTLSRYAWVICLGETPVGALSIVGLEIPLGIGEVQVLVDPAYHNQGIATLALTRAANYAFAQKHPSISYLRAIVREDNLASCRVMEKVGFIAWTASVNLAYLAPIAPGDAPPGDPPVGVITSYLRNPFVTLGQ